MDAAEVERLVWEHLSTTEDQRDAIAMLEQGTAEWLASRVLRLTVSNAGTAVGNNPYAKPNGYALDLAGLSEPIDPESYNGRKRTEAMKWGHDNEDLACEAYEMFMTMKIEEAEGHEAAAAFKVDHCGLVVDLERPWLGASPDGIVGNGLLEIKCPVTQRLYPSMPPYYYDQITAQMAILKKEWCDFVVWTPTDMNVWHFEFDAKYWADFLLPRLEDFYHKSFLPLYVQAVVEGRTVPPAKLVERILHK